jgi:hypothetical protein
MIYTSYFAKANELTDVYRVSVSLSTPKWFKFNAVAPELAPTWQMIDNCKKSGDFTAYTEEYFKLLRSREPRVHKTIDYLEELALDNVVLLCCWEKAYNRCHRHLIAKYANKDWKEYTETPHQDSIPF